ncbi:MAG: serine/threonine protein kinase, partial [Polyangiaceae bacterium]|nr:serine/threonine protein kinase [Polyangiaceae bacterium]
MMDKDSSVEAVSVGPSVEPFGTQVHRDAIRLLDPLTFGRYTLIAELGRGATGDVFLALTDGIAGFQKLIVLKILHEPLERDPESVLMFLDEARVATRLAHPNIIHSIEVGEAEGRHWIAMEYIAGMGLDRILRDSGARGRLLPIHFCARVAVDVLAALAYAHELRDEDGSPLGIVHRDVSPANILVGWDGAVKLVDFGISKARSHHHETEPGFVRGRLSYMAPEQAEGVPVDARADVWSVGVVLFELLTGRKPFIAGSGSTALLGDEPPPPVSSLRADVPEELSDMVAVALQRNRAERYPSAAL